MRRRDEMRMFLERRKIVSRLLNDLGANVRDYRIRKKLTQAELAQKAKLHQTHISRIENGKKDIFLVTLYKIARALDVRACDLVKERMEK